MSAPYVGNNDFRGYLAYLGQNGDALAKNAVSGYNGLGFVDNSGTVNTGLVNELYQAAPGSGKTDAQVAQPVFDYLANAYQTYKGLQGNVLGASTTASSPSVNPDFVNQAYDTKIAGLKSVLDTLQPQQDSANLQVQNQYTDQANSLATQQAQGHRNLTLAQNQVDDSKAKSLNDLRNQVQTMGMSYNNQLGAYGAGDSSAAGLIQQALSGMASKNRANVMDSAGQQTQGITLQGQDLDTEFQTNMKALDDWKSSSLNDIATKFLQQKQQIQQAMVGANADRYQALAQADASYTNQAISQLASLENTYKQQANDLVGRYQSMTAPNQQISSNMMQYAVNPISAGQIANISNVPQVQSDNSAYYMPRKFNEDYGLSLQPGY